MTTYNDIQYGNEIYCDETAINCDSGLYYSDGSIVYTDTEAEA